MVADRRYGNVTSKLAVFIIPPMPDRVTSSHIARPHKVIFSDPFVLQNVAGSSYPVSYWYNFILEYPYGAEAAHSDADPLNPLRGRT